MSYRRIHLQNTDQSECQATVDGKTATCFWPASGGAQSRGKSNEEKRCCRGFQQLRNPLVVLFLAKRQSKVERNQRSSSRIQCRHMRLSTHPFPVPSLTLTRDGLLVMDVIDGSFGPRCPPPDAGIMRPLLVAPVTACCYSRGQILCRYPTRWLYRTVRQPMLEELGGVLNNTYHRFPPLVSDIVSARTVLAGRESAFDSSRCELHF